MKAHSDADDFVGGEPGAGPLFDAQESLSAAFAASKVSPSGIERVVAEIIWRHQGRGNPISIAALCKAAGQSERSIKGIVEQLVVTHRMRIGGYRGGGGDQVGYAVIVDAQDQAAAVGPYLSQIRAMVRRLRVLTSAREVAELLGQLSIEEGQER